jgi:oligopeptide/dipeptide ABC transporter ATP-binding protein
MSSKPLIETRGLKVHFQVRHPTRGRVMLKAVDGIDVRIHPGETFALVGESGSGKTTAGKAILRIVEPTEGRIWYDGKDITSLSGRSLRQARQGMQIIFQNPYSSLDPRMTLGAIVGEPLRIAGHLNRGERRNRVAELLQRVGLPAQAIDEKPTLFSGGQRQRIAIARALAAQARFIVCDEPLSAIDVSLQAQIIALLQEVRREFGVTYLFISHDLGVVRFLADTVAVMYLGRIVELGPVDRIFASPQHPYTRALISAVPIPDPTIQRGRRHELIHGEIPDPTDPRNGCSFASRCPHARPRCRTETPEDVEVHPGHRLTCHFWQEIGAFGSKS